MGDRDTFLLAADIGGTKSDMALFRVHGPQLFEIARSRFQNIEHGSAADVFHRVLNQSGIRPEICCCSVAGPVYGTKVSMTNLPWELDSEELAAELRIGQVVLINDMTALCRALPLLSAGDLAVLQKGSGTWDGVAHWRAVLAPGTGLGEGVSVTRDEEVIAHGTEGGHASFAPVTELQKALLSWLQQEQKWVSYEDVASGSAIGRLYDFLAQQDGLVAKKDVVQSLQGIRDRTPIIMAEAVRSDGCPVCQATLSLFLEILGAEAGNLALKVNPTGGLFLGGGILPRLYGNVSFSGFLEMFAAKSKMSPLLKKYSVYLILRGDAPLLGAAGWAMDLLRRRDGDAGRA